MTIAREDCLALDARDPLASLRQRFVVPDNVIYLDGNSLGALPRHVPARMRAVVEDEWGAGLIRSWNDAGWIDAAHRAAAKIAPLIGATPDEVIVADSTSVNLFKLLVAAMRLNPGRDLILTPRGNFPTDTYIAQGVADLLGVELLRVEPDPNSVLAALDARAAVLTMTHVDYRTGRIFPMREITDAAHAAGALMLWDLSHSAGALELDLDAAGVDLAVGCGYKYLNGGPGAPAYAFVARRLVDRVRHPLSGWLGHAAPFTFADDYSPAPGIDRLQCGTPPMLSLAALESALDAFDGVSIPALRAKSMALGDLFVRLVDEALDGLDVVVESPRNASVRGSQVSLSHPSGYAIVQALIARGVIGDFRAPDVLRFGFAPLYVRFVDIFDAVNAIERVIRTGEWKQLRFVSRKPVT
ncbi:MAG TPA: kynureninase [Casimicrobiaceae bacterium]|nr:kynureninase [Casimicrobiaceae bacterium]